MAKLLDAWESLFSEMHEGDYDEQQDALFRIGLVLERHNPAIVGEPDLYEESLSRELLRLTLNDARQRAALDALVQFAEDEPKVADAVIYALGRARAELAVESLLKLIDSQGKNWSDDAAYQAVFALDTFFRTNGSVTMEALNQCDIRDLLEAWSVSGDDMVADKSDTVLSRIAKHQGE